MARNPSLCMALGSGRDGWLTVELDSLRFVLEIENGKRTVETLTLSDLRAQYPNAAGLMAELLAEAVRVNPVGSK